MGANDYAQMAVERGIVGSVPEPHLADAVEQGQGERSCCDREHMPLLLDLAEVDSVQVRVSLGVLHRLSCRELGLRGATTLDRLP
jgi:hypothetical protein